MMWTQKVVCCSSGRLPTLLGCAHVARASAGHQLLHKVRVGVVWVQAAEDAIMAEMAQVKAGMERRQKREKRKKLEQKKKARIRAAQAVLGTSLISQYFCPWSELLS